MFQVNVLIEIIANFIVCKTCFNSGDKYRKCKNMIQLKIDVSTVDR